MYEYYQYLILFFIIVIYYKYVGETYTLEDTTNVDSKLKTNKFYFIGMIIIFELLITYIYIALNLSCASAYIYLFPLLVWVLFLLGVFFTLENNPGFVNAFSDVVGYYSLYSKIQDTMSELEKCIDPSTKEIIAQIKGDKELLFNSMSIRNFDGIWEELNPSVKCNDIKQELFNLVIIKNKIGEICWYVWTSVVAISVVSLYISTTSCELTDQQITDNLDKYNEMKEKETSDDTLYNPSPFN
jgi:hypothetical protein